MMQPFGPENPEFTKYLRDRHGEYALKSYFVKVWGYNADGEEVEITEFNLNLEDLIEIGKGRNA